MNITAKQNGASGEAALHFSQAIALAHSGAATEAAHEAQLALDVDPQCIDALDLLARIEARAGRLGVASAYWREAEDRSGGRAGFRQARERAERLHRWRLAPLVAMLLVGTLAGMRLTARGPRPSKSSLGVVVAERTDVLPSGTCIEQLRAAVDPSVLEFRQEHAGFVVVPRVGLFRSGTTWAQDGETRLAEIARILRLVGTGANVRVIGHADDIPYRGDSAGNAMLSAQRALTARAALLRAGIAPGQTIVMELRGADSPPFPNEGSTRIANRTATFAVEAAANSACAIGKPLST